MTAITSAADVVDVHSLIEVEVTYFAECSKRWEVADMTRRLATFVLAVDDLTNNFAVAVSHVHSFLQLPAHHHLH